jgi:hypothetical protein
MADYTIAELEQKRDETLLLAGRIKKAKQAAIDSGSSQEKIDEIDADLTKALVLAGTYQRAANELAAEPSPSKPPPPAQEPVPPAATAPAPTATTSLDNTTASDDNSYDKPEAARITNYSNPASSAGSNQLSVITEAGKGSTQAGSSNIKSNTNPVNKSVGDGPKPGARLKNPLGNFSSYTYQLSLYMITPDAHTAFVANGRKNINTFTKSGSSGGGAYLILQSGGVNTNLDKRPPGMNFDYYIDDLRITNAVATQQTATSSNITKITFNIIEPYGFSLITKLKRAREELAKTSKTKNIEKATNASKQFFVLGIRFQGYDANGEIATASKYFSDDTFNTSPDASGVYERFYEIMIEKMTFKLTGGATVYSVVAKNIAAEVGLHVARGTVNNGFDIVADTVGNALEGDGTGITSLMKTLTANEAKLKDKGREIPDQFAVRFIGTGVDLIQNATLRSESDNDKKKSAPSNAGKSSEVNESIATKATYDNKKVKITIRQGTSILQAIQLIIQRSSYLQQAMDTLFNSEQDETKNSPNGVVQKKDPPVLRWYNVSPEIETLGFDTKINDFAYKITYVIQPYETPAAVSAYGKTSKYYGPHKRYDYWYTGKNSEIISYEQQFDNTFFNVSYNPNGDPAASGGDAKIANLGNKPTNQKKTGSISPGNEAENTYMTSLFDPGSYAQSRIQILGDPDYLMREAAPGVNELYQQFYQNNDYTINPNGGQVFIEIAFNEGIDYDIGKGTMSINDSIFFWDYPESVKSGPNALKGVSYQVRECESIFKGGKFTQTLQLNINTMPDAVEAAEKAASERSDFSTGTKQTPAGNTDVRTTTSQAGNTPTPGVNANNASGNTGLVQDDVTGVDAAVQRNAEADAELLRESRRGTVPTLSTPTNNANTPLVANDDSVSNSGTTQAGAASVASTNANILAAIGAGREPTTVTDVRTADTSINFNAPGGV